MKIAVVDAQGGGLGKVIVEKLKERFPDAAIIGLGTNVMATSAMRKAGAEQSATGENAVIYNVGKVDIVIGGIGIIAANGMMGEITAGMAEAVSSANALKVLIPMGKCSIYVPGCEAYSINELLDKAMERIAVLYP
ncbi:MAG: DUF3842 family protein [Thermoclostridium sp.]|nr:DUF3842 family protein [Thermoclostridium sp.]